MDLSASAARPRRTSDILRGVLWFFVSMACFVAMAVAVRDLRDTMNPFEVLTWRSMVGLLLTLPFVVRGGLRNLHSPNLRIHGVRNTVHFCAQATWVYALMLLPLVEVTSLEFSIPLFTAILAPLILKERVGAQRWGAIALGFVGVLIVLRPGTGAVSPAALIMLAGATGYALSGVLVKLMTRSERASTIVFYMNLMQFPLGLVSALAVGWTGADWGDAWAILVLGATGVFAHYAIARGLALADITILYPLDFLRLPFMALIGWLLYAEGMDLWVVVGAVVIFAADLYLVLTGARQARMKAGENRGAAPPPPNPPPSKGRA
ncbi:MAG: DMT family transporter [Rhodospirillales bacterium]